MTDLWAHFYGDCVAPLVTGRWPRLPHAAGLLGAGSEVLGLDDERSQDHDWGLRLTLLVPPDMVGWVQAQLRHGLPEEFAGRPVRYPLSGSTEATHHVEVTSVSRFVLDRLGVDPRGGMSTTDWLALTGQSVVEVVAGPVYADSDGALTAVRHALHWYPDQLWHYLLASAWGRLDQELPLVGRTGERGDDLGSRVITARLADAALHLGFLLHRTWMPYPKWRGTVFAALPGTAAVLEALDDALSSSDWRSRQRSLALALEALAGLQRDVGLPAPDPAVVPFWDRPFVQVDDAMVIALTAGITDPPVQGLPHGVGSIEQWCHDVDVLVRPARRLRAVEGLLGGAG